MSERGPAGEPEIVTARGDNPGAGKSPYMPPWLAALGVKSGEYFVDSKPRARRAMQSEFFSPAARIHICLGLATMGFQQELAVKMEGGERVPMTPADVCNATGIRREHFRRHMAELEAYGLAECRGSKKGQIEMFSWAVPRDVDREKIVTARGDNPEIKCHDGEAVSEALLRSLKHYRIRSGFVAARGDIAELERLARVTKEAELSLRDHVERLRAQAPLIRKKETAINVERNGRTDEPQQVEEAPATAATVRPFPAPIREPLRAWLLGTFSLPTTLDDDVLDRIAAHVPDDEALAQFQLAAQGAKPRKWILFVGIASKCATHRAQLAATADREHENKCLACHGTGRDRIMIQDNCRECGGSGKPAEILSVR